MKLKQLFADDDAVSPVIGVILMVAITVILAAVIASFVLGLGDQSDPAPTADFNFDFNDDSTNTLLVTHGDGDELDANQVFVRGSNFGASAQTWNSLTGDATVAAGDSHEFSGTARDYQINIVWEDPDSDTTSTLSSDSGPDA